MAYLSSTFDLERIDRRNAQEAKEMNRFHNVIREQLASIYQDLYPVKETVRQRLLEKGLHDTRPSQYDIKENGSENGSLLWDDDHFNGWVRRMILGRPELAPLAYQYYA